MSSGITHNNKDVMFKMLSQSYENKSLAVYGLKIPKIKRLLPSNYPTVAATEIYADNVFLLEDGSLLILEYESSPTWHCFLKYNRYVIHAIERLKKEGIEVKNVIIAVIYTGDIKESASVFNVGAVSITIQQVFLSNFDTDEIYTSIRAKIESEESLTDDDIMRLIILPLTQPKNEKKQKLIEDAIDLAKKIQDEKQQLFVIAGILTATDKFIDQEYSEKVKGWIRLTKVARLFEEEKIEAVNIAVNAAVTIRDKDVRYQIARDMLDAGDDILKVMQITKLTRAEIKQEMVGA